MAQSSPKLQIQQDATHLQPRRSTRRSTEINTTFKTTKSSTNNTLSPPSKGTKRKATTPNSPTPTKKKRNRPKPGYVPPSTYAHLPHLPDALAPNLHILFCGLNPGLRTAQTGHAYNHPTNRFWKLMHTSRILPVACRADEDRSLPARFRLGLTNIVHRPSRNGGELSAAEMDGGVAGLEDKVRRWRPEVVCVVGKGVWEAVWRVRHGGKAVGGAFRYGWQEESENMGVGGVEPGERIEGVVYSEDWNGARVFVATSTSGLAATVRPEERERIWRELGVWMEQRRAEEAVI